jgi:hypothetical protein
VEVITALCGRFFFYLGKLKDRLNLFVNVPRRNNNEMSNKLWTNNNAESITHVFKVAVNWKPQSTPELINKIYDCVDIQFLHLRSALHSSGHFPLLVLSVLTLLC